MYTLIFYKKLAIRNEYWSVRENKETSALEADNRDKTEREKFVKSKNMIALFA